MRIRLHSSVVKLVNKNKGPLSANAEVNRALTDHYEAKKRNEALMRPKRQ